VARAYKRYPVQVRRVEGKQVTALVSVYGNVDLQGDVVQPGAFDASIARWIASGDPIPLIWSHDWGNPLAHVGTIDPASVRSDDRGLTVTCEFKGETEFAQQVQRLVEGRRVTEWSFSYDVVREEEDPETGANRLVELDLIEAGPTLKGANPETGTLSRGLLSAKSLQDMLEREARDQKLDAAGMAEMERLHTELDGITQGVGAAKNLASDRQLVSRLLGELELAQVQLEALDRAQFEALRSMSARGELGPMFDRETYEALASLFKWEAPYEAYVANYQAVVAPEPPKQAVNVFTGKSPIPEFDGRFAVRDTAPIPAGEPEKFSGSVPVGQDDSPFRAQITNVGKAAAPRGDVVSGAFAVLAAVNQLASIAPFALAAGLLDAQAALTVAARDLRDVASGMAPASRVDEVVATVAPIAAQLREAGAETTADNLDRALEQLAAGVAGETISNEAHLRGDVG
jgi:HK97 family phage prohead protease